MTGKAIEEIDVYQAAEMLLHEFGENAILEAMMRLERYRSIGNNNGMAIWRRIANVIEFLQVPANLTYMTIH